MSNMLTDAERIRALETNLENWPWDTSPSFKLEKEEAEVILKLIKVNRIVGEGRRYA